MEQGTLTLNTKAGIVGGTLLSVFGSITGGDIEKTVVLGALGAVVSFIVSLLSKTLWEFVKQQFKNSK